MYVRSQHRLSFVSYLPILGCLHSTGHVRAVSERDEDGSLEQSDGHAAGNVAIIGLDGGGWAGSTRGR